MVSRCQKPQVAVSGEELAASLVVAAQDHWRDF